MILSDGKLLITPNNAYIGPSKKSLVYSHPTDKQCSYEPDLSSYVKKSELVNYGIPSSSFTLIKAYNITVKTIWERPTTTAFDESKATKVDIFSSLPKRSCILKIVGDACSMTYSHAALNGSNSFAHYISNGFGGAGGGSLSPGNIVAATTDTISITESTAYYIIDYYPQISRYYGSMVYSSSMHSGVDTYDLEYKRITALPFVFGGYHMVHSYATSESEAKVTCTLSGSPKFRIYVA